MTDNLDIFGVRYNNVTGIKATDTNGVVQTFVHPRATKGATTYTPTTTSQTIAAGTYLSGVQTIQGDADLVAGNIKNGVQIFGVTGNLAFITYYTGSTTPSAGLGQNGDIYLKTGS